LHNPNLCNRCNTHVEDGSIVKISVLFADIRSFTEKTHELGPEQIHEVTDAFLQMATNDLVEHDAYVDKYMGDSVMAFFNIPIQRKDHASQAVAAALEIETGILQLQERFGLDLKAGIGIATGWARVGRLGSKYREDYTAIGDVVNLAARLEGQAKPGEILIHSEVYEEVAADFPDAPSESLWLKGFQEPVLTYYLHSSSDSPQLNPGWPLGR
jgi:adenylate cyclase